MREGLMSPLHFLMLFFLVILGLGFLLLFAFVRLLRKPGKRAADAQTPKD